MLETAEARWAAAAVRSFPDADVPPFLWAARLNASRLDPYVAPRGRAKAPVVHARANHGRWQACCPFCPSAQHASLDGFFYCASCLNATCGHRTLPLVLPKNLMVIEAVLMERPVENRNWEPAETVKQLEADNRTYLSPMEV